MNKCIHAYVIVNVSTKHALSTKQDNFTTILSEHITVDLAQYWVQLNNHDIEWLTDVYVMKSDFNKEIASS